MLSAGSGEISWGDDWQPASTNASNNTVPHAKSNRRFEPDDDGICGIFIIFFAFS
jgi:hypothetical protein